MITRRNALGALATATLAPAALALAALARPALAQPKPARITVLGTSSGQFHFTFAEEVAPAFEAKYGIKVDVSLLPQDALNAKLRAELSANTDAIDIIEWTPGWGAWLSSHLEDHDKLLAAAASRNPDWDWDDFPAGSRKIAFYDGRQIGVPYRVTLPILFYRKSVLDALGAAPPRLFSEFRDIAIAATRAGAPDRFGVGFGGRQGAGMVSSFGPYLLSFGGNFFQPKTREILINTPASVAALDFYAGMLVRDKVAPPEVTTWEFDEIIANGQNGRYAMAVTLSPYGSLMNDPKLSRTAGDWRFAVCPGATSPEQSKVTLGGWQFSVSAHSRQKEWAFEFLQMATSKEWLRKSMLRGNAAPRVSVLDDPDIQARFPWAPVVREALSTAEIVPQDPIWPTMESQLRVGISRALLGEVSAKAAMDGVAGEWQRTLRRSGGAR